MANACRAFASICTLQDLQAQKPELLASLKSMQARFEGEGHVVQAAHLADAVLALEAYAVPGLGEWDEETLEHEQFRLIDKTAEHLAAARDAHLWRSVMPVEVRESVNRRMSS